MNSIRLFGSNIINFAKRAIPKAPTGSPTMKSCTVRLPPMEPGTPKPMNVKLLAGAGIVAAGGALTFMGSPLTGEKRSISKENLYETPPLKAEEVQPEKKGSITSIMPNGTPSTAVVQYNRYQHNTKELRVLIAGGTGDAAYHNLLYFLKMGAEVTITSRSENPLETPEMKVLVDSLTEEERQLIRYVKTPTDEEGWLKLLEETAEGKKKVHFNNLLGVPAQENNEIAFREALERTTLIAKAAAKFEEKHKGKEIQLCIASSPSIDMLKGHLYAEFKLAEEVAVLENGPKNTTIIRIPYVESPDAPIRRSTSFGIKEMAYLPLQPLLGAPQVMLPIAGAGDIGKIFGISIEGKAKVTAVAKMTCQNELTEAIGRAYNNEIRMIIIHPKIAQKLCELIGIGHATDYSYHGIMRQIEDPLNVSDPNFELLLDRPAEDPVKQYNEITNQGKMLRHPPKSAPISAG